jgi:TetR/AcrR family transcriptional regulator, tetracycline repressor protein
LSRPLAPLVSRESAVRVAIALIERDGLDGFSLPKLARAMNVKTPSLYHHFESRSDLCAEIAAAIVRETRLPKAVDDPQRWQDWFVELAFNFREAVFRHRRAALLIIEYVSHDTFAPTYNASATLLSAAGVPADLHFQILDGLESVIFGATVAEAARGVESLAYTFPSDDLRFPALTGAIRANRMSSAQLLEAKVRGFLTGVLTLHQGQA